MALLAAYMLSRDQGETLEDYLNNRVFAQLSGATMQPDRAVVEGFNRYMQAYQRLLRVEQRAVEVL